MLLNAETGSKARRRNLSRSVSLTQKTMRKVELRVMLLRGLPRQCSSSTMKTYLEPWRPCILSKWWAKWQKSVMRRWMRWSHSHRALLSFLSCTTTKEDTESTLALATAGIINWQGNDSKNTQTNTHTCTFWTNNHFGLCVADAYGCLRANTPVQDKVLQATVVAMMEWRYSKEAWFLFDR